ncbi:hypothetical protein FB471_6250 [Amycolatopsis cihanbeyliensis]|uniref:Uncharacterized protein n=1 Tax=Amycolatopsis cihanbeyliensis TaxID=1128664 RepID=A0A542CTE1_AMYCI|nr:hypothetical protein FB471_6250 [Amycolatopsis cihanbeyliensis]
MGLHGAARSVWRPGRWHRWCGSRDRYGTCGWLRPNLRSRWHLREDAPNGRGARGGVGSLPHRRQHEQDCEKYHRGDPKCGVHSVSLPSTLIEACRWNGCFALVGEPGAVWAPVPSGAGDDGAGAAGVAAQRDGPAAFAVAGPAVHLGVFGRASPLQPCAHGKPPSGGRHRASAPIMGRSSGVGARSRHPMQGIPVVSGGRISAAPAGSSCPHKASAGQVSSVLASARGSVVR